MDKILSFLFGSGWWLLWYAVLWAAVAPSLALIIWLLRAPALAGQHPGGISTLQGLAIVLHPLIIPARADGKGQVDRRQMGDDLVNASKFPGRVVR